MLKVTWLVCGRAGIWTKSVQALGTPHGRGWVSRPPTAGSYQVERKVERLQSQCSQVAEVARARNHLRNDEDWGSGAGCEGGAGRSWARLDCDGS